MFLLSLNQYLCSHVHLQIHISMNLVKFVSQFLCENKTAELHLQSLETDY